MKKLKSIRLDEDLIDSISAMAEKDGRTFSNQVERLLLGAITKKPNKTATTRVKKPDSFKEFFALYPPNKKGGTDATAWNKAKALKLTDNDFQIMIGDLSQRKILTPDWYSTYAVGITKYLSDAIWLTPIIQEQSNGTNQSTSRRLSHADNIREQARANLEKLERADREAGNGIVCENGDIVQGQIERL